MSHYNAGIKLDPQPIGDAPILMMEDTIRKADAAADGNTTDK